MRILDLTSRLLSFAAGGLMDLGSWPMHEQAPGMPKTNEKVAGPPTDWRERAQNISSEFWLDFFGSSGIIENRAGLNQERTETNTKIDKMTNTSVEELTARSTDPAPNKIETTEPPPRRRVSKKGSVVKAPFLRFNLTPVESATQCI